MPQQGDWSCFYVWGESVYHCRDTYSHLHDFTINLPHLMYSFKHRLSVLVWRLAVAVKAHVWGVCTSTCIQPHITSMPVCLCVCCKCRYFLVCYLHVCEWMIAFYKANQKFSIELMCLCVWEREKACKRLGVSVFSIFKSFPVPAVSTVLRDLSGTMSSMCVCVEVNSWYVDFMTKM